MSLTFATYTTTIANLTVYDEANADFVQIMPSTINYAEDRIYRELNLLSTVIRDTTATCTANSRTFTLPSALGTFQTIDGINIVTPNTSTLSSGGMRNPVTPAERQVVDYFWPSEAAPSATSVPTIFGMVTDQTLVFGPPPGGAFQVEVIGNINPAPLSATNTTTYLTTYLPDLFVAASMVFMSGFMRTYGSQSDDPKLAQSWEQQYQTLFASADLIDARQKFAGAGWTSKQPEPFAAQPR